MATVGWQSDLPLAQALEADYANFNYYQLIRLLRSMAQQAGRDPETCVRFAGDIGAAFPAGEISALNADAIGRNGEPRAELKTPNYAMASVMGPLAEPYVEWMRDRARDGDTAMAGFLDLFNNRFHGLRYRAKASRYPGLHLGRPEDSAQGVFLEALIGLAQNYAFARLDAANMLQKRKLLALAGLLVNHRRSAPVLERILGILLNVRVRITQLVGAWHRKQAEDLSLSGRQNCRLGVQTFLGSKVWDQQARIRLHIGPLGYAGYQDLLPGNRANRDLACILRYVTNRVADYEVFLELDRETLPLRDGGEGLRYRGVPLRTDSAPVRLGQTAWLRERVDGSAPRFTRFVVPAFEVAA